jgi:hypothetical protein
MSRMKSPIIGAPRHIAAKRPAGPQKRRLRAFKICLSMVPMSSSLSTSAFIQGAAFTYKHEGEFA